MTRHRFPAQPRHLAWTCALLVVLTGCGSDPVNADPLGAFQPQVSNAADNFSLQATGLSNVSTTVNYTWANSGTRATINHSTTTQAGSTLLVIKDANGATVYSKALSPSLNEPTSPVGVAGSWSVQLTLTNYSGTLNFRAQKL